jgi:hypothetical protein
MRSELRDGASFDVAVVGAGMAGIAAALSASALGARTLIVESSELLGGNATAAFVHSFCGLYLAAEGAGREQPLPANEGLPLRFAQGLADAGGAGAPERVGRVWILPTDPEVLAAYAAAQCAALPQLTCLTDRRLTGIDLASSSEGSSRLRVGEGDGVAEVSAGVVLDTSGDGVVGVLGGADFELSPESERQVPSFIFRLAGVGASALGGSAPMRLSLAAARAAADGELPETCESVVVRRGLAPGEAYLTVALPRSAIHAAEDSLGGGSEGLPGTPSGSGTIANPAGPGQAEARARRDFELLAAFLRENRPGFEESFVSAWPRRLGVREGRRLMGLATVEAAALLGGVRREDEVALASWPIELWSDHRRARFRHSVGPSSIPLGALVSRSHPRLGMAGRCLSASHEALGSLRVIGTALATGEAAGVAAALAADAGGALGDVEAQRVRDTIQELARRAKCS